MRLEKKWITLHISSSALKTINKKGISASSEEIISGISKQKNLSKTDAEILSTYVRGMHCSGVK